MDGRFLFLAGVLLIAMVVEATTGMGFWLLLGWFIYDAIKIGIPNA